MRPLALTALLLLFARHTFGQGHPRPYTQLYVFGDSYSDTGAGFLDADGPTAVAYLAQRLSIPFTHYGDPDSGSKSLNFAVTSARTGEGAGERHPGGVIIGLGMVNQVEQFANLVHSGQLHFDPAQTMFFLAGGLNDRGTPNGYTRTNLEAEIETLYAVGARRFMVALLPTQIPAFAAVGTQLNPEIARIPSEERSRHGDIRIANSRWGPFLDQVISHPADYGLTDTVSACTHRAVRDQNPDPCLSPKTHFYCYEGHPSTAAHRAVGDLLYTEALTKSP